MNTQPKRLYRSRTNRMISGICGGIGDYLNLDPTIIRLLFVLVGFLSGGLILLAYVILIVVIPEEPTSSIPPSEGNPAPPADI